MEGSISPTWLRSSTLARRFSWPDRPSSTTPIPPVNSRRCWQQPPASAIIHGLFKEVFLMRKWLVLALLLALSGCGKKVKVATDSDIVERDRDLYDEAMKA